MYNVWNQMQGIFCNNNDELVSKRMTIETNSNDITIFLMWTEHIFYTNLL